MGVPVVSGQRMRGASRLGHGLGTKDGRLGGAQQTTQPIMGCSGVAWSQC
jgi:hypothetical protein